MDEVALAGGDLRRRQSLPFFCVLVWSLMLMVGAVVPGAGSIPTPDSVQHASAYGVEAGLLFWLLARSLGPASAAFGAWAGATILGAVTELMQLAVPFRRCELRDVVADAVGAVLVVAAWLVVLRSRAVRGRP